MKADLEVNIYDVDALIRNFFEQRLGIEIGTLRVKSWNQDVYISVERGGIILFKETRHKLRIEHSAIWNTDGSLKS